MEVSQWDLFTLTCFHHKDIHGIIAITTNGGTVIGLMGEENKGDVPRSHTHSTILRTLIDLSWSQCFDRVSQ